MFRHVIAPARFFSQVPNEIIRHPRLCADAVRLLTWQLSLHADADESLSKTARRAGIGKGRFQRAKQELKQEGYVHEWRAQGARGRWRTTQYVSNTPVSAEQATVFVEAQAGPRGTYVPCTTTELDDVRASLGALQDDVPGPGPTPEPRRPEPEPGPEQEPVQPDSGRTEPVPRQERPSAVPATAGAATGRDVGRPPHEHLEDNTSHPPPDASSLRKAEQFLLELGRMQPGLAMSRRKARRWAPAAAPWLELGLTLDKVRNALTQDLATARSPLGVLLWRLKNTLPDLADDTALSASATPVTAPRLAGMRECKGTHTQPRLFTPVADESRCADCRTATAQPQQPPSTAGSGYLTFRAARRPKPTRDPRPARSTAPGPTAGRVGPAV